MSPDNTPHSQSVQDPHRVLRSLLYAHYNFHYLNAGFRFGLFKLLAREPGLSRGDIAKRLGLNDQPARILLRGCVANGLLSIDAGGYRNTAVSEPLAGDFEELADAFLEWELQINYRPMAWFYESLKEDTNSGMRREIPGAAPTLYGRLAADPHLERVFHKMMGSVTRRMAADLVGHLDMSSFSHLLDIGGGTAVNATYFASRWPDLRITICDLPTIAETANSRIAASGLRDRVRAVGINAFTDEFPGDADCVLFAHFLEIWSASNIKSVLAKAARAVKPGGGIFVVTPGDDEQSGAELAVGLSAYFHCVASGEGMVYPAEDFDAWLTEAGFKPTGFSHVGGLGDVVISGIRL